jgi:4-alpha-glucanotransferase
MVQSMETNMGLEKLLYLQGVGAEFIDCFGRHVKIDQHDRLGIVKAMLAPNGHEPLSTSLNKHLPINSSINKSINNSISHDEPLSVSIVEETVYTLDAKPWLSILPSFQYSYVSMAAAHIHLPEQDAVVRVEIIFDQMSRRPIDSPSSTVFTCRTSDMAIIGEYYYQGVRYCRYQFTLNQFTEFAIPDGYHHISVEIESAANINTVSSASATLLIAPNHCFDAGLVKQNQQKLWGISVQLYSLKKGGEGFDAIGDFSSLKKMIEYSASMGADFVMLNPLHALDIANPDNCSPYSPTDRRRLNPLYIDLDEMHNLLTKDGNSYVDMKHNDFDVKINHLKNISYKKVFDYKYRSFVIMYELFSANSKAVNSSYYQQFRQFVEQEGQSLQQFCADQVCQSPQWLTMPEEFYAYLQFIAVEQLKACQAYCTSLDMKIGLIGDLAIGALLSGNEVQSNIGQFCTQASIGAPPDPFSASGQNWGLTPLDPVKLKQADYQHFIDLLRTNMRFYGAIRIDHVMGLLRLWWWPVNKHWGNGAYVYYPLETLLAIVCIESHRANCIVIGEDLGTVPPEIIDAMAQRNILSNQLFYFTTQQHQFCPPDSHKTNSLMMLANHDVAPLKAWWQGEDLLIRQRLAQYESEQDFITEAEQRDVDKWHLIDWLVIGLGQVKSDGLHLPDEISLLLAELQTLLSQYHQIPVDKRASHMGLKKVLSELVFNRLLNAWLIMASTSNSTLFCVQLADLMADNHCVNIPGTWKEFPNWQRRLPMTLTQLFPDKAIQQRCQLVLASRNHHNQNE